MAGCTACDHGMDESYDIEFEIGRFLTSELLNYVRLLYRATGSVCVRKHFKIPDHVRYRRVWTYLYDKMLYLHREMEDLRTRKNYSLSLTQQRRVEKFREERELIQTILPVTRSAGYWLFLDQGFERQKIDSDILICISKIENEEMEE